MQMRNKTASWLFCIRIKIILTYIGEAWLHLLKAARDSSTRPTPPVITEEWQGSFATVRQDDLDGR